MGNVGSYIGLSSLVAQGMDLTWNGEPEPLLYASLTPFDCTLNRAGQARLKVQDANPVWMNEDARHARVEASCFLEQSLCVFLTHRAMNHGRILRCDALNCVDTYRPANEEDLRGRKVTVDTHRHL